MIYSQFILPSQAGAFLMDGSLIIVLCILLTGALVYKNRNNLSLSSTELETNTETEDNKEYNRKTHTQKENNKIEDMTTVEDENEEIVREKSYNLNN